MDSLCNVKSIYERAMPPDPRTGAAPRRRRPATLRPSSCAASHLPQSQHHRPTSPLPLHHKAPGSVSSLSPPPPPPRHGQPQTDDAMQTCAKNSCQHLVRRLPRCDTVCPDSTVRGVLASRFWFRNSLVR